MFVDSIITLSTRESTPDANYTGENCEERRARNIANNMAVGKGGGEKRSFRSLLSWIRGRRGAAAAEAVSGWRHRRWPYAKTRFCNGRPGGKASRKIISEGEKSDFSLI